MYDPALREMDWYRWYGPLATRPASDQLFLAEAVPIVGKAICVPWIDLVPLHAMLPDPVSPSIPTTDEAFVDGRPVAEIHEAFGMIVREILADGAARFDTSPRTLTDLDTSREIYRATMEGVPLGPAAWEDAIVENEFRRLGYGARNALRAVADVITDLAHAGLVRTYARPMTGGFELRPLKRKMWRTAEPTWRLASCSMSLADPFDPLTEPTHHIFVDREDLEAHLEEYARTRAFSIPTPGLRPDDQQHFEVNERLIERTVQELDAICAADRDRAWRRDELQDALEKTPLGKIQMNVLDAARKAFAEKYPKLLVGGAPRGPRKGSAGIRDVK